MGESAIPCARHAIIGGSEASFVELVSHADGRSSIVIYTVDGGRQLYAIEVEWRQGPLWEKYLISNEVTAL